MDAQLLRPGHGLDESVAVDPELFEAAVQVLVVEAALVIEEPVMHLPEAFVAVKEAGGLGGPGRPAGIGMQVQVALTGKLVAVRAERKMLGRERDVAAPRDDRAELPFDVLAVLALVIGEDHEPDRGRGGADPVAAGEPFEPLAAGVDDLFG